MSDQKVYKLITINSAPERATRLVGRVAQTLQETKGLQIKHVLNVPHPSEASQHFIDLRPDLVFAASMWTPEESGKVLAEARDKVKGVRTLAIPQGLQVERGPDAVVEWLVDEIPKLIAGPAHS